MRPWAYRSNNNIAIKGAFRFSKIKASAITMRGFVPLIVAHTYKYLIFEKVKLEALQLDGFHK
jgi:hypothetical protein